MPVHRTERGSDIWSQTAPSNRHPASWRRKEYILAAVLGVVGVVVLCGLGFFLARALLSDPSSTAPDNVSWTQPAGPTEAVAQATLGTTGTGQSMIALEPQQGYIGTLVTVSGGGWFPGEPVFVFLRAPGNGDGASYAYAAAVAGQGGELGTGFTFPNEMRWMEAEWAEVLARGNRSGREAVARFSLVAPTPTSTSPPPTLPPAIPPTNTPRPTDTPLPSATPTAVVITDWRGEYYANLALAGEPVLVRNDVALDFFWGTASPGEGVPADGFSVRWARRHYFGEGAYRFAIAADDGVRMWLDGQLLVDDWQDGPLMPHLVEGFLLEGDHELQIDYYENLGDAGIQVSWEQIELPTPTPTATATPTPTQPLPTEEPTATIQPSSTPTLTPEPTGTVAPTPVPSSTPVTPLPQVWLAQYYARSDLEGEPVLVQEAGDLSYDWSTASPAEGIPADYFSARWVGEGWLPAGSYRYHLDVDDGARLWIDGQLVLDAWQGATGQTFVEEVELADGVHSFLVEYFESEGEARIHLRGERVVE